MLYFSKAKNFWLYSSKKHKEIKNEKPLWAFFKAKCTQWFAGVKIVKSVKLSPCVHMVELLNAFCFRKKKEDIFWITNMVSLNPFHYFPYNTVNVILRAMSDWSKDTMCFSTV